MMKKLTALISFLILFTSFTCENEPLEGDFVIETELSCEDAAINLATAATNFSGVTPSDSNYTQLCIAYKNALQDQIDACGDTNGAIQMIIDSLGDCGDDNQTNDCETATTALETAETAYNADTTNENLCNAYKTALQNKITACGDTDGSIQAIIDGLGDCSAPQVYEIGDIGPGGGFVFYLDGNGGGMEIAPIETQFLSQWGCYSTNISGTQSGLGFGAANTDIILQYHIDINFYNNPEQCQEYVDPVGIIQSTGDVAAKNCDDLNFNGFDDWYLPSIDELLLVYNNLHLQGMGDMDSSLSSSTQSIDDYKKIQLMQFTNGSTWGIWKHDLTYHRAIRSL